LGAGIAVNLLQPKTEEAKAFLAFGLCSGVLMLTAPPLYHPDWAWLTPLNLLAQSFWGATFLHLGLVFPVMRPFVARRRAWLLIPYACSAFLTLAVWRGFYAPQPNLGPVYLTFDYTAVAMVGLAGLLVLARRQDATPLTRARLRIVLR